MVWLGRIAGAIVGFVVAILITQVIISGIHTHQIDDVIVFAAAVLGALVGSSLARRFGNRNAKPS
jgi:alpha-acetolactate decarboxylase